MRIRIDFDKITEREKGYLCGFYVGDGNIFVYPKQWIYRLRFHTYVNEIHVQNNLVKICSKLCNNIRRYKAKNNTVIIEIHSKDLLASIDKHVTKNGLRNLRAPISFRKGFIEGMTDSDGYVQRKYAEITTLNKKLKSNLILDSLKTAIFIYANNESGILSLTNPRLRAKDFQRSLLATQVEQSSTSG